MNLGSSNLYRRLPGALVWCLYATTALGQQVPNFISEDFSNSPHFFQIDILPQNIELGETGRENVWNFMSLVSPRNYTYQIVSANEVAVDHTFQDAQFCQVDPWGNVNFLRQSNSEVHLVGQTMALSAGGRAIIKHYSESLTIWKKDLSMGQSNRSRANWSSELGPDELSALNSQTTRKLRIRGTDTIQELMDAEGLLYLPGGYYNAFRIFREWVSEIEVLDAVSGVRLHDQNELVRMLKDMLEKKRSVYLFIDRENRDVLAEVMTSADTRIESVWFRAPGDSRTTVFKPGLSSQFILYPTTSDGAVRLNFENFTPGEYGLVVYNIIGKPIWRQKYQVRGMMTVTEDLSFLPKGTYIYSLTDSENNKISTRRFVIINP